MKTLIMALSLALVSSMALAQPAGAPPGGPKGDGKRPPIARIKNDLDLTDEQVKKMREIRDQGGSRADMQAVLTPEQRAKAAGLREEHQGEREERKAHMQEYLGLSDEQKTKMAEIRKQGGSRDEMRAVLTPEQQAKFDAMRSQHQGPGQKPKPAANPEQGSASKPAE
jgi:Spy/CpxP family protein refolding chaperone